MIKDVSSLIDVFDTPLCPFCGNPVFDFDFAQVCACEGNHFLAHVSCVNMAIKDNKENES